MSKNLKRKERNKLLRTSLYEKYILKDITIDEYYRMKNEYEKREEIINKDIDAIQSKLFRLKKCESSTERMKKAIKDCHPFFTEIIITSI